MSRITNVLEIIKYIVCRPEDFLTALKGVNISAEKMGVGRGIYGARFICNPQHIFMGKRSYMGRGAHVWIHDSRQQMGEFVAEDKGKKIVGRLVIGDNVRIGENIKIDCYDNIEIGDNCLLASDIYITDNNHGTSIDKSSYVDVAGVRKAIRIGKGSWIGERVCILAGSNIGERCIIGTNAVVTGEIPDYSMAVGIPARVIKKYNFKTRQWENVIDEIDSR